MARNITTTNYSWPNPDPSDKASTAGHWGEDLYTCIESIDTDLKAVSDAVPSYPLFLVHANQSADINFDSGTAKNITYTETYDRRSEFSSSSFQAATTGTYKITCRAGWTQSTTTGYRYIRAYVNSASSFGGKFFIDMRTPVNGNVTTNEMSIMLSLTAADIVQIYGYQNGGVTTSALSAWGSLLIEQLG